MGRRVARLASRGALGWEDLSVPRMRRQASTRLFSFSVIMGSGLPSLPRPQQDPSQGSSMPRKNYGPHSATPNPFLFNHRAGTLGMVISLDRIGIRKLIF